MQYDIKWWSWLYLAVLACTERQWAILCCSGIGLHWAVINCTDLNELYWAALGIADISHYRHYQRLCTFFKPVYFFVLRSQSFGYFVANFCTFWCTFQGLDNVVVYQNWQIPGMGVWADLYIFKGCETTSEWEKNSCAFQDLNRCTIVQLLPFWY